MVWERRIVRVKKVAGRARKESHVNEKTAVLKEGNSGWFKGRKAFRSLLPEHEERNRRGEFSGVRLDSFRFIWNHLWLGCVFLLINPFRFCIPM